MCLCVLPTPWGPVTTVLGLSWVTAVEAIGPTGPVSQRQGRRMKGNNEDTDVKLPRPSASLEPWLAHLDQEPSFLHLLEKPLLVHRKAL